MTGRRRPSLLLSIALLVTACSTGGSGTVPGTTSSASPAAASPALTGSPEPGASGPSAPAATGPSGEASPTPGAPVLTQAWATAELTDVVTGATFRIADLAGRTIILETMAIWCTNCRAQQGDAQAALQAFDPARVAFLVIDVDPNETADSLKAYRERNGFTGTYVVASPELARALAAEFGDQVLNPPSTPMIAIGTDGRVTLTEFGHKSPDEVAALARDHGA